MKTTVLQALTLFSIFSLFSDEIEHATVSIYALDTRTSQVLIDENSQLSLHPSSCLKVITTAAALHLLGENHRFQTYLEYDGILDQKKTLKGNLYIRGGGDPCLGSNRIPGCLDWKEQIESWAMAIKEAGIHTIEGNLFADTSSWEKSRAVPSWEWEDLGNYYGAGALALSFHENFYSLTLQPGLQIGDPTRILGTEPPMNTLLLENEVTTGPKGSGDQACIYGSEYSYKQTIQGTIPGFVNEFTIKGAIPDPATLTAQLLKEQLKNKGISVLGESKEQKKTRTLINTLNSPPLKEIVFQTNQHSINLYAEHLLKKMGEVVFKDGSTKGGIKAVSEFYKSLNIDLTGFHMADGSGLSRKNLITTKQLVEVLVQMKKSSLFPLFFKSLPQIEDTIHAKSGSMSLVKGYTGYVGEIAFAVLINNCTSRDVANSKIQEVFTKLKELSKRPLEPKSAL